MSLGLGGGKQKSSSSTTMLSPEEQESYYNRALRNVGSAIPQDVYAAPEQQTLTGGDYTKLQGDMFKGYTAGLDRSKAQDLESFNNSAGAKGIWSSGLALKGEQDITEGYNPAYAAAGGQATQAALGAKQNELSQGNQMALTNAALLDSSKWKKADFLSNLWTAGKGSNSQSSGSSWNANVSGSMPK